MSWLIIFVDILFIHLPLPFWVLFLLSYFLLACMLRANFIQYMQVLGWSMWFSEYLFLERSWAKDENTLKVRVYEYPTCLLTSFYMNFCICLCLLLHYLHFVSRLSQWILGDYMQKGIQRRSDYPQPFWLALFVEGTRFTEAKLLAAQEYAASTGQPVPRNVLIPRTKVKLSLHLFSSVASFILRVKICICNVKSKSTFDIQEERLL